MKSSSELLYIHPPANDSALIALCMATMRTTLVTRTDPLKVGAEKPEWQCLISL